jgi:hypothetical protein
MNSTYVKTYAQYISTLPNYLHSSFLSTLLATRHKHDNKSIELDEPLVAENSGRPDVALCKKGPERQPVNMPYVSLYLLHSTVISGCD